ncbi:serine/threonine-protein phosphatase [Jiangella aurantiaca]|uniref:Serine/threonine-protein phosphatase n=1 Tax=Jiangella aurantiaca TaxID=2530373 RepID=A0A4R5ADH1_9ACTN|nr:PP2C family protein-serine/threonine phosphatase [Jiangella aurantiaca]TDD69316.1 serine/threonine-protein phosphatase [Jiangella aurantiaca]
MTTRSAGVLGLAGAFFGGRPASALTRRLLREPVVMAVLLAATLLLGLSMVQWESIVPAIALVLPLLFGGLFVPPRALAWLVGTVAFCLIAGGVVIGGGQTFVAVTAVVGITGVVSLGLARSRARLGLQGTMGESMLVDLRDRLAAQGRMPPLGRGWQIDLKHHAAERSSFSGDFAVASRSTDGRMLELALVDVSGKGHNAGTRALLLSGAFGGLLGSLPPDQFLPAANAYLLRQRWPEGFATAVHLVVDLTTGEYEVRSAGHPPAIHFHAGSGRWATLDTEGGLLGVYEQKHYEPVTGRLRPGDALMLYTDGLVEAPRRDLSDGIDKLQGEAERLVAHGFAGGAQKLINAVASSDADDRALLLLWRTL